MKYDFDLIKISILIGHEMILIFVAFSDSINLSRKL